MPQDENGPRALWPFLGLAVLLHFASMPFVSAAVDGAGLGAAIVEENEGEAGSSSIDVDLVEPDSEPSLEAEKEEEEARAREERTAPGQVVEISPPKIERHPVEAKFVSEYDQTVIRETRARSRGESSVRPVAPPPGSATAVTPSEEAGSPGGTDAPVAPGGELPSGTGLETGEGRRGDPLSRGDLTPDDDQIARAVGSPSLDYLDDLDDGDETLLNSKRWRFASFFNRVKRQVAENWHPEVAYRRRDPYGNIYGFRDRITVLRVELKPDGSLQNLFLDRPSGVGFLDDEAIASFHAAQPFPNPPRLLVDERSGMITFRFGFVFELSNTPSFRVFRYSD